MQQHSSALNNEKVCKINWSAVAAESSSDSQQGIPTHVEVVQVELNNENIKNFRKLSCEVAGRTFSVPENNHLFFAYRYSHNNVIKQLVGAACCRPAVISCYAASQEDWEAEISDSVSSHLVEDRKTEISAPKNAQLVKSSEPEDIVKDNFMSSDCHAIEYLFIDRYFQRCGYGTQLLQAMESHLKFIAPGAPVRLWAASAARRFFFYNNYKLKSQKPLVQVNRTRCFQHLYPMEKMLSSHSTSSVKVQSKHAQKQSNNIRPG